MFIFSVCVLASLTRTGLVEAQIIEITENDGGDSDSLQWFRQGVIETFAEGVSQATAEVMRLRIGEAKFNVPAYLFLGAAGQAWGDTDDQTLAAATLLNPIGGNFAFGLTPEVPLWKTARWTSLKLVSMIGEKAMWARELNAPDQSTLLWRGLVDIGLRFQTGVWNVNDPNEVGVFWIQAKGKATTSVLRPSCRRFSVLRQMALSSERLSTSVSSSNRS